MQAITAGDEKSPNMLRNIGKTAASFFLSIGFTIFCFIAFLACHITSSQPAHAEFWRGGAVAVLVFVLSIIVSVIADYTIKKMVLKKDMQYWDALGIIDHLDYRWGWWTIFGPAFLSLLATSFVFFPLKESVVLIDGKVLTDSYAIANPWRGDIIVVFREHAISVYSWQTTKDGVAVRGTVSANLVLGDDPSLWVSDENLKTKAEKELQERFKSTVAKMDVKDLLHGVVIEAGIADQSLAKIGLKWKPESVITVSNVHAAPPKS